MKGTVVRLLVTPSLVFLFMVWIWSLTVVPPVDWSLGLFIIGGLSVFYWSAIVFVEGLGLR